MGMDLGNSVGSLIGAGTGLIGGAISGFRGTPDQVTNTSGTNESTSQTTLEGKNAQQRALEKQSYQEYLQQLQLANLQQQAATEADPFRQAALQQQLQVLTGEAFGPNAQESQQIQDIRNSMVAQGSTDINKMLDERLRQTVAGAAGRGLRGQALGELEGRVIDTGAQQLGALVNQANLTAAQLATSLPYQRLGIQNQTAGGGLSYAQQLQQQALNNRAVTQNPYLLQQLQNERLQTGKNRMSGSNTGRTVVPGTEGGFWNGIQGAMMGSAAGANAGAQVQQAIAPQQAPVAPAYGGYYSQPATVGGQKLGSGTTWGGGSYGSMGGMA